MRIQKLITACITVAYLLIFPSVSQAHCHHVRSNNEILTNSIQEISSHVSFDHKKGWFQMDEVSRGIDLKICATYGLLIESSGSVDRYNSLHALLTPPSHLLIGPTTVFSADGTDLKVNRVDLVLILEDSVPNNRLTEFLGKHQQYLRYIEKPFTVTIRGASFSIDYSDGKIDALKIYLRTRPFVLQ